MVCTRCSVGACSIVHPNVVAMVKSRRLNGSAMFALLGTLLSICVSCCRLCQAQCDPMRLLSGWCLPDPLLIAWVAGSLSHSCMYGCVSSGLTRAGVTMAAQASRKYMYARLLVKCLKIFQGTTPWITIGVFVWWEYHCRPSIRVVEIKVGHIIFFCEVAVSPCSPTIWEESVCVDDCCSDRYGW